jgi:hypothetical protein
VPKVADRLPIREPSAWHATGQRQKLLPERCVPIAGRAFVAFFSPSSQPRTTDRKSGVGRSLQSTGRVDADDVPHVTAALLAIPPSCPLAQPVCRYRREVNEHPHQYQTCHYRRRRSRGCLDLRSSRWVSSSFARAVVYDGRYLPDSGTSSLPIHVLRSPARLIPFESFGKPDSGNRAGRTPWRRKAPSRSTA